MSPAFMLLVLTFNTNSEQNPLPTPHRKNITSSRLMGKTESTKPKIKTVHRIKIYCILSVKTPSRLRSCWNLESPGKLHCVLALLSTSFWLLSDTGY